MIEVNYWAVLIAGLSSMAVGAAWYSMGVFGASWARLAKVDMSSVKSPVVPILSALVASMVTAWVLAAAVMVAWTAVGGSFIGVAVLTAAVLWLGLVAARFLTHDAFEGRPLKLTSLNIGNEAVTVLVMAAIIGLWPPAGTA